MITPTFLRTTHHIYNAWHRCQTGGRELKITNLISIRHFDYSAICLKFSIFNFLGEKKRKAKQSMFLKSTGIAAKLHFIMDMKATRVIKKW